MTSGKQKKTIPHKTLFFRVVSALSRLQFRYLYENLQNPTLAVILFMLLTGSTALGTLVLAAHLFSLPLIFPPLGPSAFIIFHTPMSPAASPRNTILAHSTSVASGLIAIFLVNLVVADPTLYTTQDISFARVLTVALATALSILTMLIMRAPHPPAVASALLAAFGYLDTPVKVLGLVASVVVLTAEGQLFNRVIGGLPYPVWKSDPEVVNQYGILAGIPDPDGTFGDNLVRRIFRRRKPSSVSRSEKGKD